MTPLLLGLAGFLAAPGAADHAPAAHVWLAKPDPAYTLVPLWFWNDALDDGEIRRQMADFRAHGVNGFAIHPRMGLPADIPYMGERWMGHVRAAVTEARRTGMRVCLYDEGMYPSGSAHGEVVAENPAYAVKGLMLTEQKVTGVAEVARPAAEGEFIAWMLAAERDGGGVDLSRCRMLDAAATRATVPEGAWRVMVFTRVPSEGHIRGIHFGEDDGDANAPPAADLLHPDAMQSFIRHAYDPYYGALKDDFGSTIFAMFTDEPDLLGRGPRRGLKPWTPGLAALFAARRGYDLEPVLPALFVDAGPRTGQVRDDFALTLAERLEETYYAPLSRWCAARGIALTGHPAGSDEIRPLRHFQIPCQDVVWRYVVPDDDSALTGVHSTMAKCASSAAFHDGRPRNGNEALGAFGWNLTMEETKWLTDWLVVRGVNLIYPHAFYYSIRDERVHERPPDVGMHNAWWPHYRLYADYVARMCRLVAEGEQVCDVAVLSLNGTLPWRAARHLYEQQVDFNYLEDWRLVEQAEINNGVIHVASARYAVLIIDEDGPLRDDVRARCDAFAAQGGRLITFEPGRPDAMLSGMERDVIAEPVAPSLRYRHVRRDGNDYYLFVNEGGTSLATTVTVGSVGAAAWFDGWAGEFAPAAVEAAGASMMRVPLHLDRRESAVLCVDSRAKPRVVRSGETAVAPIMAEQVIEGAFEIMNDTGKVIGAGLGEWSDHGVAQDFGGTRTYRVAIPASPEADRRYVIDLGDVGDFAVLRVNGKELGVRFWAPYRWDITDALHEGENELAIAVTNSFAARYAPKKRRPSGLFGPVRVITRTAP